MNSTVGWDRTGPVWTCDFSWDSYILPVQTGCFVSLAIPSPAAPEATAVQSALKCELSTCLNVFAFLIDFENCQHDTQSRHYGESIVILIFIVKLAFQLTCELN